MSRPLWSVGGVKATVSSRHGLNPDRNLWNYNGTYWCHYTLHNDDHVRKVFGLSAWR